MKFYTSVLPHKGRLLVRGIDHDGSHKKFALSSWIERSDSNDGRGKELPFDKIK